MLVVLLVALIAGHALAQTGAIPRLTQEDDYTHYELLAAQTAQFRI